MDSFVDNEGNWLDLSNVDFTLSTPIGGSHRSVTSRTKRRDSEPECIINKLPVEIIAYTFKIYVDEVARSSYYVDTGVFTIGAVCRLWRHVAWTAPPLWTDLHFALRINTTKTKVYLAIDWIARSGGLLLDIFIHTFQHPIENEPLIFPLINVINQCLGRCRVLHLHQLTSATFSRFSSIEGPSSLKELYLCPAYMEAPLILGDHAAPTRLTTYVHLDFLVINWNNLTEFTARGLDMNEIMDTLRLAPRLSLCNQFGVDGLSSISAGGSAPLTHLKLECLMLMLKDHEHSSESLEALFQRSTFPNLAFCSLGCKDVFPTETFFSFIARSSCAITTLNINYTIISSEDLIKIARVLPSIKSFSVTQYTGAHPHLDAFFTALCQGSVDTEQDPTPTNGILFPSLRSLTVTSHHAFPWELILALCNRSRYNDESSTSTRSVQGKMEEISIYRIAYATDFVAVDHTFPSGTKYLPSDLMDSWATFQELLELREDVTLLFEVRNADNYADNLFDVSYRKLLQTQGNPPDHIRENEAFKIWIANNDASGFT